MMCAVRCNGMALAFASESLCDNEALVMEAVTAPLVIERNLDNWFGEYPTAVSAPLMYASPSTKVSAPLMYASPRLRKMHHIVRPAINRCGDSILYASKDLQTDKSLLYAAADNYCDFRHLPHWPELAEEDPDLLKLAVIRHPRNMCTLPNQRFPKWSPELLKQVLERHGHALLMSSIGLYYRAATKENILIAARTWGDAATALAYTLSLKDRIEVVLEAIKHWPYNRLNCYTIPIHLRNNYRIARALGERGCYPAKGMLTEQVRALETIKAVFSSEEVQNHYSGPDSYPKTRRLYWWYPHKTRRCRSVDRIEIANMWLRDNYRTAEWYPDNFEWQPASEHELGHFDLNQDELSDGIPTDTEYT